MARAIWSGTISFGLVNVPVKLYSATESKDIAFHQFQEGTGERIRNKRVAEDSGEEVEYSDIVKGYEVSKGKFVIVTPEELESVDPEQNRTIDIEDFVDLDEIDPIYFEKTYYLGPSDKPAEKPYELLRAAMQETNKVALARFVMRTKQYLVAVRAKDDLLVLETMFFPDEIRNPTEEIEQLPVKAKLTPREREVATKLIDSLSTTFDPDRYHDTYREAVLELIKRKAKGEEIVVDTPKEQEAEVVDLMAALEASLAATKGKKAPARKKSAPKKKKSAPKKKTAATKKKTAAKKAS